jgi:Zn-dependent protease
MSDGGREYGDPLDRLAAEEDWSGRVKAVEAEVARDLRKARWRRARTPRLRGIDRAPGWGVSPIFLALVALLATSGWALWAGAGPAQAAVFVFVLCGWLVTLCLHEFAHALTAHRGGDDTIAEKGYLRLDPLKYGHPVLTFILPLFFLVTGGLPLPGGAVLIETHRLRNRLRDALVSAAGPAVNVAAAAILLVVVSTAGPDSIYELTEPHAAFWAGLTLLAYLQVAGAILNLMPVPGLDGYGMIEPYLPDSVRSTGNKIRPFGILLVFLLLYLPPVRQAFGDLIDFFPDAAGAPVNGAYWGYQLFHFWRIW